MSKVMNKPLGQLDKLKTTTTATKDPAEEALRFYHSSQKCQNEREVLKLYDDWAGYFDTTNNAAGLIKLPEDGARLCRKYVKNSPESTVLDIAGGTGNVGQYLRKDGFQGAIDMLDGSKEMLRQARKKNLDFRNMIHHVVTGDIPFLSSESYDGVVICGALLPNYLPASTVEVALLLVKVGGYLIFNDEESGGKDYYRALHEIISKLQADGKVKHVEKAVTKLRCGVVYINFVVHAFKKLSN